MKVLRDKERRLTIEGITISIPIFVIYLLSFKIVNVKNIVGILMFI